VVLGASNEPLTPVIFVVVVTMVLLKYTLALAASTERLPGLGALQRRRVARRHR
jgi:hypothetical protein